MTLSTKEIRQHWIPLRTLLTIRNERDYDRAVRRLNELLDEIGTNERHPLYGLLDTLGTFAGPAGKLTQRRKGAKKP